jgi:hypothetical protein
MVRLMRLVACLLPALLVAKVTIADVAGWVMISCAEQGGIYHQRVAGSAYPRIMIRTTFEAPPVDVYRLVNDYDRFAAFVPNVKESRVVYAEGQTQWVYHHLQFPGPVADRVYLLESSDAGSRMDDAVYRIAWRLSDRNFADVDLTSGVRPDGFTGHWLIEPGDRPGTSRAEYVIHSEPGGLIPAWLVTRMSDRYVRQLVDAIRQELVR